MLYAEEARAVVHAEMERYGLLAEHPPWKFAWMSGMTPASSLSSSVSASVVETGENADIRVPNGGVKTSARAEKALRLKSFVDARIADDEKRKENFVTVLRRLAACDETSRTIFLAHELVTELSVVTGITAEAVRQLALHEIAHALVGGAHGHDEVWQGCARAVGCWPEVTRASGEVDLNLLLMWGAATATAPKTPSSSYGVRKKISKYGKRAGFYCEKHRRLLALFLPLRHVVLQSNVSRR